MFKYSIQIQESWQAQRKIEKTWILSHNHITLFKELLSVLLHSGFKNVQVKSNI